MSKPIRVGFIGLSSSNTQALAGQWGRNGHLPYLKKSPEYIITALCNSSIEAAKKAIQHHGLDAAKISAYGDPEVLANDPKVDLVVCAVNVAQHYNLVKPALAAGKMVFCEWPLGSNLEQMKELAALASDKNLKTMVGLQGRNGPYVQAIRNFLGDGPGQIGQVLSTSMATYAVLLGLFLPQEIQYLAEAESGGNVVTIKGIHLLDTLTAALGEIKSFSSVLKNKRPTLAIVDNAFNVIEPSYPNTVHDHMLLHGELAGDIPFSFQLRGGPQFKGTPEFDWRIYCTRGEIRITTPQGNLWMVDGIKVQVYDFIQDKVEDVELDTVLDETDPGHGFQPPTDNVARLYAAFAKGDTDKYLDFQQSLKWAEFIQTMFTANK